MKGTIKYQIITARGKVIIKLIAFAIFKMQNRAKKTVTLPKPLDSILKINVQIPNCVGYDLYSKQGSHYTYITPKKSITKRNSEETKDYLDREWSEVDVKGTNNPFRENPNA